MHIITRSPCIYNLHQEPLQALLLWARQSILTSQPTLTQSKHVQNIFTLCPFQPDASADPWYLKPLPAPETRLIGSMHQRVLTEMPDEAGIRLYFHIKRLPAAYLCIGCPRIIRTCSFSRFSPLRWNRWCCGFQNFQNYSSGVKAKRHTLPKSAYYSVQSLDQISVGESFFPFCSKTKQATRYWQEAQPRLPQQTHWHDICWRA